MAGRYVEHVRSSIQRAFVEEKEANGITQAAIAHKLGVSSSVISRELHGLRDISLGRVAEYAWALNRNIHFELPKIEADYGINEIRTSGHVVRSWQSGTTQASRTQIAFKVIDAA